MEIGTFITGSVIAAWQWEQFKAKSFEPSVTSAGWITGEAFTLATFRASWMLRLPAPLLLTFLLQLTGKHKRRPGKPVRWSRSFHDVRETSWTPRSSGVVGVLEAGASAMCCASNSLFTQR
jgi:hypothetical protein